MELKQPANPRYSSESMRLRSFDSWPKGLPQKPEDMADAGLYYTGQGDKVRCYYCDGGLKDWNFDDKPWEEHARWFDTCTHVLFMKGEKFIRQVKNRNIMNDSNPITNQSQNVPNKENVNQNRNLYANNFKNMTCKICLQEELCMCFIPCGHAVSCAKCMLSLKNCCPICREMFFKVIRLYF